MPGGGARGQNLGHLENVLFMPPTLKKLVGHIALGLSVCPHHFFLNF